MFKSIPAILMQYLMAMSADSLLAAQALEPRGPDQRPIISHLIINAVLTDHSAKLKSTQFFYSTFTNAPLTVLSSLL